MRPLGATYEGHAIVAQRVGTRLRAGAGRGAIIDARGEEERLSLLLSRLGLGLRAEEIPEAVELATQHIAHPGLGVFALEDVIRDALVVETEVLLPALVQLVLEGDVVEEVLPLTGGVSPALHLAPDDDAYAVVVEAAAKAIGIVRACCLAARAVVAVYPEAEVSSLEELASGLIDLRLQEGGEGVV